MTYICAPDGVAPKAPFKRPSGCAATFLLSVVIVMMMMAIIMPSRTMIVCKFS